jgi:hypothetical protein
MFAGVLAATESRALAQRSGGDPDAEVTVATVKLDGRALFRVAGISALPAEQRAGRGHRPHDLAGATAQRFH